MVFAAAGATTAPHAGSSGVSVKLRAQLGYADCLASLVSRPALLRRRTVIARVGLVVKRSRLKGRQHRVLGTGQQDPSGVHALVWQFVHKAVQICSHHDLNVASRWHGGESFGHPQHEVPRRHEHRTLVADW